MSKEKTFWTVTFMIDGIPMHFTSLKKAKRHAETLHGSDLKFTKGTTWIQATDTNGLPYCEFNKSIMW